MICWIFALETLFCSTVCSALRVAELTLVAAGLLVIWLVVALTPYAVTKGKMPRFEELSLSTETAAVVPPAFISSGSTTSSRSSATASRSTT